MQELERPNVLQRQIQQQALQEQIQEENSQQLEQARLELLQRAQQQREHYELSPQVVEQQAQPHIGPIRHNRNDSSISSRRTRASPYLVPQSTGNRGPIMLARSRYRRQAQQQQTYQPPQMIQLIYPSLHNGYLRQSRRAQYLQAQQQQAQETDAAATGADTGVADTGAAATDPAVAANPPANDTGGSPWFYPNQQRQQQRGRH
ncbi:hypothetical protein N7478_012258 [Penicillium angulare]|uniref:uncharacterized protein n=1 Tax=Penicillium angulare TaxID=116970 RepID=UPI00253FC9BE|nr:uncharacterized protein N7478_012258 [Penicillium angulare]KAJ5259277.1 hypothetical protein N7478_012258 [Penicillium angulare]